MPDRVILFVSSSDAAALKRAGSCALAAASMNDRVDVFLFGAAAVAATEAHGDPDHPAALLQKARSATCRLLGCSAELVEAKVPMTEAEAALDAVVGWTTVLEWSRGVADRFFF